MDLLQKLDRYSELSVLKKEEEFADEYDKYTKLKSHLKEMAPIISELVKLYNHCMTTNNEDIIKVTRRYMTDSWNHNVGFGRCCSEDIVICTYGGGFCKWGSIGVDSNGNFISDGRYEDSKACSNPKTTKDYKKCNDFLERLISGIKEIDNNFHSDLENLVEEV